MIDTDLTPRVAVDLVVDDAEASWEDLVLDLIAGPADPSRILTDCGACQSLCGGSPGCLSGGGCGLSCNTGGWRCSPCDSACR